MMEKPKHTEALAQQAAELLDTEPDDEAKIRAAETLQAFRLGYKFGKDTCQQARGIQAPAGRREVT